jgi:hypothetical protein
MLEEFYEKYYSIALTYEYQQEINRILSLSPVSSSFSSSSSASTVSLANAMLPKPLFPTSMNGVLVILSNLYLLIYSFFFSNNLTELMKKSIIKQFLNSQNLLEKGYHETILLLQEYYNNRIKIHINTISHSKVSEIRMKAYHESQRKQQKIHSHLHDKQVNKENNINGGSEERGTMKTVQAGGGETIRNDSLLVIQREKAFSSSIVSKDNVLANSLFSSREFLRSKLLGFLTFSSSSLNENEIKEFFNHLMTFHTIILNYQKDSFSSVASSLHLSNEDIIFYLEVSSHAIMNGFFPSSSPFTSHILEILHSWESILYIYNGTLRITSLSFLLSSLQHFFLVRSKGSCSMKIFTMILDFFSRISPVADDYRIIEMFRNMIEAVLSSYLEDKNDSSLLSISFPHCYSFFAWSWSILQRIPSSSSSASASASANDTTDIIKGKDWIRNDNNAILREKLLKALLLTLFNQNNQEITARISTVEKKEKLQIQQEEEKKKQRRMISNRGKEDEEDKEVRQEEEEIENEAELLDQQYEKLLEIIHFLSIDSHLWNIEGVASISSNKYNNSTDVIEEHLHLKEMKYRHLLLKDPFDEEDEVEGKLSFDWKSALEERASPYLLVKPANKTMKSSGFPLISEWKNKSSSTNLSGFQTLLLMLLSSRCEILQTQIELIRIPHALSSVSSRTKRISPLEFNWIRNEYSLYQLSLQSLWMISPLFSSYFMKSFYHLSLQDNQKGTKGNKMSHIATFTSLAVSQSYQSWSSSFLPAFVEILTCAAATDFEISLVLGACNTMNCLSIEAILNLLSRCDALNKHSSSSSSSSLHVIPNLIRLCVRSLLSSENKDNIEFYLPQFVQLLRRDVFGNVGFFLQSLASSSPELCHQLVWLLQTEASLSTSNHGKPKYKDRYGLCGQLPGEDPLPSIATSLLSSILFHLSEIDQQFLTEELQFFDTITAISGKLKDIKDKEQHPAAIRELLSQSFLIRVSKSIYMPTNPFRKVIAIDFSSPVPMQSAAKCPFLLKFITIDWNGPDAYLQEQLLQLPSSSSENVTDAEEIRKKKGCGLPTGGGQTSPRAEGGVTFADEEAATMDNTETIDPSVDIEEGGPRSNTRFSKKKSSFLPSTPRKGSSMESLSTSFRTPKSLSVPPATPTDKKDKIVTKRNSKRDSRRQEGSVIQKQKTTTYVDSCIFKVFDDCRQDILTIQVIKLMKEWFHACNIPVFLSPYAIISNRTGDSNAIGGILQVRTFLLSLSSFFLSLGCSKCSFA